MKPRALARVNAQQVAAAKAAGAKRPPILLHKLHIKRLPDEKAGFGESIRLLWKPK